VERIVKKKVVTYFKAISFTFSEVNENIREVDQVDMNSPKRDWKKETSEKKENEKKIRKLWKLAYRVYYKSVFDRWKYK
jgi:hypothetical protein